MTSLLSRLAVLCGLVLLGAVAPATARDVSAGPLKIMQPWLRATPKGATVGGGYMTIVNSGTTADRLTGGTTTAAARFEIHEMTMDNGIMRMRPLARGLEIKAGETVKLAPGGFHVMLVGLTRPLKQGEVIKATLQFEKAGAVPVEFVVQGIGATRPPAAGMPPHGH